MESLGQVEFAVIAFFIVIGPLIFFHETGHYLVAKLNKITVEEFGIGLPPRMKVLFEKGGTKFTLNWLPLGGFMRPAGEDDPTIPGGLAGASKLARIAVLAAGPGANVLVGYLLLVAMFMVGAPEAKDGARVTRVEPNTPAEVAGLEVGDIVGEIDNVHIGSAQTLTEYVLAHQGEPVVFAVTRGGNRLEITLTPRMEEDIPDGQGPVGIQIEQNNVVQQYGVLAAFNNAGAEFGRMLQAFVELPAKVLRQQIPLSWLRPLSVIGISQLGGSVLDTSVKNNVLWPIIRLTAFISLALAVTNLLPIPALDGGRILFVIIEAIRGRRIDPRRETIVHFVGFALLLGAMLVFVFLDIFNPLVVP